MIIKRITADNILKYRKLEFTDLPAQGKIGICGPNESGKTAIGETICLALFGRTFSLKTDELHKAVRWGEYFGSVLLEFTGRDGRDYRVVREIDTEGKHVARLDVVGEPNAIARGVEAVSATMPQVLGFGYDRFVNSFYLAQREMKLPQARSATVKALIGVAVLEDTARELREDRSSSVSAIANVQEEIVDAREQLVDIGSDREALGKLEGRRVEMLQAIATSEAKIADLSARQTALDQAAAAFAQATREFARGTTQSNYAEWRSREQAASASLVAATAASQGSGGDVGIDALESAGETLGSFGTGLADFGKLCTLADRHRQRIQRLLEPEESGATLDEPGANPSGSVPTRFADRRAHLMQLAEQVSRTRRPQRIAGALFMLTAGVSWVCWAVLSWAPQAGLSQWLVAHMALGASVVAAVFLVGAMTCSLLVFVLAGFHRHATRQITRLHGQVEKVDEEAEAAREEIRAIESLRDDSVPDAIASLGGIRDDLLQSSVVALREGDGAILIKPDALEQKLDELRDHSTAAERSLQQMGERFTAQCAEMGSQADKFRAKVRSLDGEIEVERRRWEQVEGLQRVIVGLEEKKSTLGQRVQVLELADQLIDGTCRRIDARVHPELRRFVNKVLPRLTNDRYQHLQIDDDFNVRVFSSQKGDFVGLEEISSGTHRQLMLCLRLALSQALICSATKARQFIFFDEPFAFFDKERMAFAVEALGRFSPQITQVWLAAQEFDESSTFDVFVRCGIDSESLIASGKKAPQVRPSRLAETEAANQVRG